MAERPRFAGNLLRNLSGVLDAEQFDELLCRPGVRIERIVSTGQVSADWYDQAEDEWVLLLAGAARLLIEGSDEIALTPGDHLLIPAHVRHRVTWTDDAQPTVWLAVHLSPDGS